MRRPPSSQFRIRSFEPLESRFLLAADSLCQDDDSDEMQVGVAHLLAATDNGSTTASDAGSTAGTAYELGELGATQSLSGSVGGRDISDVLRFTLADEAEVAIGLDGLSRDIDLYLFDAAGQRLAVSNKAGSAAESISQTLDAGTYYIVVAPWRRAFSSYTLSVGASSNSNNPDTPNDPGDDPVDNPVDNPADSPVTSFPEVAYYGGGNEWNLNAVGAPESWAQGYTGAGVVVAVVDTGVDINHPDLVSQLWVNAGEIAGNGIDDDGNGYVDDISGWDFSGGDNNPDDGNGHGTHVAGTIAADANGFGATGVAPDATIMPVRVLGNNGSGTSAGVAAGIRYAAQMGADIINLSLGGGFSSTILAAIEYAMQLDVLVVAAAGNESAAIPGYPARFSASLSNVLSVGAYSSSGAIATFSNDVGSSGAVQVDAPGVGVYSTYVDNRYGRLSGTSMAAPHVAGLAALALSANENLTASQLRSLIVAGAEIAISGSDAAGGINAAVTVALAAAGQTSASSNGSPSNPSASQDTAAARRFGRSSLESVASRLSMLATGSDTTPVEADVAVSQSLPPAVPASLQQAARETALLAVDFGHPDELDDVSQDTDSLAELCLGDALAGDLDLIDWLDPHLARAMA